MELTRGFGDRGNSTSCAVARLYLVVRRLRRSGRSFAGGRGVFALEDFEVVEAPFEHCVDDGEE